MASPAADDYEMDVTLLCSWNRRQRWALLENRFSPASLELQMRAAARETGSARLNVDRVLEVLVKQRDPGQNFNHVCGYVLMLYETELGLPRHVVDGQLRSPATGSVGIAGVKVCQEDHALATGELATVENAEQIAHAILPAVRDRVVTPFLAGRPLDARVQAAVDRMKDTAGNSAEDRAMAAGKLALMSLLNAQFSLAPFVVRDDVAAVAKTTAEYLYALEIGAADVAKRAKRKLAANYRGVDHVVSAHLFAPYVFPAGPAIRSLLEPVAEAAGATWTTIVERLDGADRGDLSLARCREKPHAFRAQILARRANLAGSSAAVDAARAMRASLDRMTIVQRGAYYCSVVQYVDVDCEGIDQNAPGSEGVDHMNDRVLAIDVHPILTAFRSALKSFAELVDFGRTGALRDLDAWPVAALVRLAGDASHLDAAALADPATGSTVDRWLCGVPLEEAELERVRTNGAHTVALLRWAHGLLGPLACAFEAISAALLQEIKTTIEGVAPRPGYATAEPIVPPPSAWDRGAPFETIALRALFQGIGKGVFPLEFAPTTIKGVAAFRVALVRCGGTRWAPETLSEMRTDDCAVCLESQTNSDMRTLRPCGHAVCKRCATRLHECPICRSAIASVETASYGDIEHRIPDEGKKQMFEMMADLMTHGGAAEIVRAARRRSATASGWPAIEDARLIELAIEGPNGLTHRIIADLDTIDEANRGNSKSVPVRASAVSGRAMCCMVACGKTEGDATSFSRCSRCKLAVYCSKECQRKHWSMHKLACGRLHAAFAAASPGEPPK